MRRRNRRLRSVVLAGVTAALTVSGLIFANAGSAASGQITQIASGGISTPPDVGNDYSWSMAWFNGALYVGTSRYEGCVEKATQDFYFPGRGYYPGKPTGGYTCPKDKYDLQLQAEIWRYTPDNGQWTRVYQSPAIPNPAAPGKTIGRDIGYRSMVVYNNELYIAANTADEYIPQLAATNPPVILRTSDGTNFTPVNGAPGTMNYFNGPVAPMGYRALAVYNNHLYVTVIHDLTGDGVLDQVDNPDSTTPGGTTFTQISPSSMRIFELQVFNNLLYVGTGDPNTGYGVYSTDGSSGFTPVVTNGAGRGKAISSVVSMGVFNNYLYIGASGWFNSLLPESEEIRISPTGTWDVIAGKARKTPDGTKKPLSSLPDGFGNVFNAHFWRQTMDENNGAYYVGTNDWSYVFIHTPYIGPLLQQQYGFDVYGTCDGVHWWLDTQNAYGDGLYNFGARTMVSSTTGFYIGSANHTQGTSVYRYQGQTLPCTPANRPMANAVNAVLTGKPAAPSNLAVTMTAKGPKLTWSATAGATRYQIMRAGYVTTSKVSVVKPPTVNGFQLADVPPIVSQSSGSAVKVPGTFQKIGATSKPGYTDTTAVKGQTYLYEVVAISSNGTKSATSNVVSTPSS